MSNPYSAAVAVRRHLLSSLCRTTMAGLATTTATGKTGASSAAEQNRAENVTHELYDFLFAEEGSLLRDPAFGFSATSLDHAADQLGLSRACCAAIKPAALVHEFNERKLVELGARLADSGPPGTMHEGLCRGIRERLLLLEPYRATWAGALAAIASPEEVAPTLNHVERLTSALLAHAGDVPAVDMTWYTKRMLLGGVLGLAEVQWASNEGSLEEVLAFVATSLDKVGM